MPGNLSVNLWDIIMILLVRTDPVYWQSPYIYKLADRPIHQGSRECSTLVTSVIDSLRHDGAVCYISSFLAG